MNYGFGYRVSRIEDDNQKRRGVRSVGRYDIGHFWRDTIYGNDANVNYFILGSRNHLLSVLLESIAAIQAECDTLVFCSDYDQEWLERCLPSEIRIVGASQSKEIPKFINTYDRHAIFLFNVYGQGCGISNVPAYVEFVLSCYRNSNCIFGIYVEDFAGFYDEIKIVPRNCVVFHWDIPVDGLRQIFNLMVGEFEEDIAEVGRMNERPQSLLSPIPPRTRGHLHVQNQMRPRLSPNDPLLDECVAVVYVRSNDNQILLCDKVLLSSHEEISKKREYSNRILSGIFNALTYDPSRDND